MSKGVIVCMYISEGPVLNCWSVQKNKPFSLCWRENVNRWLKEVSVWLILSLTLYVHEANKSMMFIICLYLHIYSPLFVFSILQINACLSNVQTSPTAGIIIGPPAIYVCLSKYKNRCASAINIFLCMRGFRDVPEGRRVNLQAGLVSDLSKYHHVLSLNDIHAKLIKQKCCTYRVGSQDSYPMFLTQSKLCSKVL